MPPWWDSLPRRSTIPSGRARWSRPSMQASRSPGSRCSPPCACRRSRPSRGASRRRRSGPRSAEPIRALWTFAISCVRPCREGNLRSPHGSIHRNGFPGSGSMTRNADIARCFSEIADLLELEGGNDFRIRAYRNAADVVEDLQLDLAACIAERRELPKLPGIGADLAAKIGEICASGTCAALEDLRSRFPPGITEVLRVPGLGPKRVALLHAKLGIGSLEDLKRAAD